MKFYEKQGRWVMESDYENLKDLSRDLMKVAEGRSDFAKVTDEDGKVKLMFMKEARET